MDARCTGSRSPVGSSRRPSPLRSPRGRRRPEAAGKLAAIAMGVGCLVLLVAGVAAFGAIIGAFGDVAWVAREERSAALSESLTDAIVGAVAVASAAAPLLAAALYAIARRRRRAGAPTAP